MHRSDFFDFCSKLVSSTVQAQSIGLKTRESGVDDEWNLVKGKYEEIGFPVVFKQEHGKIFTDILGTGWPSLYLISNRMKSILEENSLTGWKTFDIHLYDKKNNKISGYYGFSITGRCASTNYKKSEILEKRTVSTGPICRYYKGLGIDEWDGMDFFTPEKTYEIFVTRKVAEVLIKNNITNMKLKNLSEFETSIADLINNSS